MIKSFLSLPFFKPPKAILVPGMYFLGFSRYSNCKEGATRSAKENPEYHPPCACDVCVLSYKCVLVPLNTLLLVGITVGKALDLTGVAAEETVKVGADFVALTLLQVVALCASCFE